MAYKPENWLEPLIEADLEAAITWFRGTSDVPKLKRDPDGRFEDDGSNLRSEIELPPLSERSIVQVVKVLSDEDPLLLLTDGFTCIRARLSQAARESLESEIGDPIDLDTKGDVFTIRRCTIVSTPWGPTEGHVQLLIDEIKYLYHLRKISKDAISVGDGERVSELMSELILLRNPEPEEDFRAKSIQPEDRSSLRFETQAGDAVPQSPQSQASVVMASSPPVVVSQSLQTQVPARRKNPAPPRFAQDGLEMASGVNLDRPMAAIPSRFASNRPPGAPAKSATISDTSANLLNVLGKRKPGETSANSVNQTEARAARASAVVNVEDSTTQPVGPQSFSDSSRQVAANGVEQASEAGLASQNLAHKPHWRRDIPKAQRRLLDSPSSWLPSLPGRQFPHPNVPMELLNRWNKQAVDKPQSVILSQSTPKKSQALASPSSREVSQAEVEGASSSSEDASEDGEEIPWSSSPARSAARSEAANADRGRQAESIASNHTSPMSSSPPEPLTSQRSSASHPSTAERRPDLPPDSSWENPVAPRALGQKPEPRRRPSPARQPITSRSPVTTIRNAPSPRGDVTPRAPAGLVRCQGQSQQRNPEGLFARSEQSPTSSSQRPGFKLTPGSLQYRPPAATTGAFAGTPSRFDNGGQTPRSSMNGPPQAVRGTPAGPPADHDIRRISQSSAQSHMPQQAPASTAQTVIKGTQMSRQDDADAMDIDRLPSRDPALEHHKRRSEHFKGVQRRQWIKANFTPDPKKPFSMARLHSAYKTAHPKDQLKLSELAEAYRDVFPDADADDRDEQRATQQSPRDEVPRASPDEASPREDINVPPTTATRPKAPQADTVAADPIPDEKGEASPGTDRAWQKPKGALGAHRAGTQGTQRAPTQSSSRPGTYEPQRAMDDGGHLSTAIRLSARDVEQVEQAVNGKTTGIKRKSTSEAQQPSRADSGTATSTPSNDTSGTQAAREPSLVDERKDLKPSHAAPSGARPSSTAIPPRLTSTFNRSSTSTPSASNANPKRSAPDHRTWLIKRIDSHQRHLRDQQLSNKRDADAERGASFSEFKGAWLGLRPGGAFARKQGGERKRKQIGRLAVLGWEL